MKDTNITDQSLNPQEGQAAEIEQLEEALGIDPTTMKAGDASADDDDANDAGL